ncbi:hypothetical protein ACJMK2_026308 [Sinanodonta woodiana]|uniref:Ig-like domain-containing protein n=1 Tax=Sinanodonta woodiana TaxID=1069815 RepID=A0ABD3XJ78_SINWO
MGRICLLIICLSMDFIMAKARFREDVVFISGCNATLEWILASTYKEAFVHSITVIDANGRKIAEKKDMTCQYEIDSSMYCEVRNTSNKEWKFVVVLHNVTQASSGNYTGRIKYGLRNEINSTIQLNVIDKPHIKEARTPILHEPLNIVCSVDDELEDAVYYWKLNGTYLNSTDRIRADHFTLIFERVTLVDKLTLISCIVCSSINCCIESDAYVPDPYYTFTDGPGLGNSGDSNTLSATEINRKPCCMSVTAKRKRLTKLLTTTINMENEANNEDCNTCPQPRDLNNPRQGNAELNLKEDMYRRLDQTALSLYDYATCTVSEENTNSTESSNKDSHYENVSSSAMCQVEKADVHVTDESYITPLNDPDCSIEQCEDGITD